MDGGGGVPHAGEELSFGHVVSPLYDITGLCGWKQASKSDRLFDATAVMVCLVGAARRTLCACAACPKYVVGVPLVLVLSRWLVQ